MSEHFIKEIEIKNYKCFQDFKAEGFSRINLIGGKNNVGKTAFMEACLIGVNTEDVKSFTTAMNTVKVMRENINILASFAKNKTVNAKIFFELLSGIDITLDKKRYFFKIEATEGIKKYIFDIKEKKTEVNINDFSFIYTLQENIGFIDNFGLSNNELITDYSAIQKKDEESFLNKILNEFDNRIQAFKIIDDKPQCKINDEYYELTEFGDGLRHLVSLVIELFKCENGHLFIDEIDNGIHYTKLDDVWKVVLEISKKLKVQIFATTHSKECIESYARVSKELEDEEITFVQLSQLEDNSIMAGIRDYEMMQYSINDGHEVRGW